jgi:hypothetical protein
MFCDVKAMAGGVMCSACLPLCVNGVNAILSNLTELHGTALGMVRPDGGSEVHARDGSSSPMPLRESALRLESEVRTWRRNSGVDSGDVSKLLKTAYERPEVFRGVPGMVARFRRVLCLDSSWPKAVTCRSCGAHIPWEPHSFIAACPECSVVTRIDERESLLQNVVDGRLEGSPKQFEGIVSRLGVVCKPQQMKYWLRSSSHARHLRKGVWQVDAREFFTEISA